MTVQHAQKPPAAWWRDGVIYQLYIRSFTDSDGDGIGDLDGITQRLDHVASLGVDAIWLNPCYPSPNNDSGYDVADYTTIDETVGGLPAFERLLAAAHRRGLKVLMDLVPNHCSSSHPWFVRAIGSPPGSADRARFHFRDGRGPSGELPPNNWRSTFGGPAWTRVTSADATADQWYLHSFDSTQPDFNWANPDVADMFDDVLRSWFDRGIDGFRIDVAYAMVKDADLPDLDDPTGDNPYTWNQPGVHDVFRRWHKIAEEYERPLTLVGEVWLPPHEAAAYISPGELDQVFYFDLMLQPWDAHAFHDSISASIDSAADASGVPAVTLNNHDVHRSVSRYGLVQADTMPGCDPTTVRIRPRGTVDVALGIRRANAAALLLLALPGAIYLYQGEELGLPEVLDLPDDARRDPIWQRSNRAEHGRDGCRIPLPWAEERPSLGFSPTTATQPPWLPQPTWFDEFAVSRQHRDPASTLALYRKAVRARRALFAGKHLEWLPPSGEHVLAFRRGGGICVTAFAGPDFTAPDEWGDLILRSDHVTHRQIPAGVTAWFQ